MNNIQSNIVIRTWYCNIIFILTVIGIFMLNPGHVVAQGSQESSSQPAVQGEKTAFTMNLSYLVSNGNRSVKIKLSRKENRKTIPVDNLSSPVKLYFNKVKDYDPADGSGLIGKTFVDNEGEGIIEFPLDFNQLTASVHEFTFIAKIDADSVYEDAEEQVTVADAKIEIEYAGDDSVKTATATLLVWKDNAYVPLPEAELKLGIKRTFNYLPFGEPGATTDEAGNISGLLPADIPGNANGTLTIMARLEDDETYGNVEVMKDVPWAVLPKINPERGRTLWSPGDNAPLLLVISSVTIIVIIWGTILYLVYLLFKIKRLGKAT